MVIEPYSDSPDFVLINNGIVLSYKEVVDGKRSKVNGAESPI
jgi:hypothetical protein